MKPSTRTSLVRAYGYLLAFCRRTGIFDKNAEPAGHVTRDGMIVTEGGSFGGYGLYLLKGKPVFLYNLLALERFRWQGEDVLAPGKHTVVFDFKPDEPGFGKGGTGVLEVDGKEVANQRIPHTTPFLMTLGETFDVGSDTRTSVDDHDYQVPFAFTGQVDKVTVNLAP